MSRRGSLVLTALLMLPLGAAERQLRTLTPPEQARSLDHGRASSRGRAALLAVR